MLSKIAAAIAKRNGRAFYVGGYVRNLLMGLPQQPEDDIDIEVYNFNLSDLHAFLSAYGTVRRIGKSFPILKISGHPEWDFAVPDTPGMPYRQASLRRDFTFNSLLMDIVSGEIIDLFGGAQDLTRGIIRHTNPEIFNVDPVRIYRAFGFAGRFDFVIHPKTLQLIMAADLTAIKPERVYRELRKLLLYSPRPSNGWRLMQRSGVLEKRHPCLFSLIDCPQSKLHHPEGDVWEHTLMVLDMAAQLRPHSAHPEALMWAALLHDVGKPATTEFLDNQIVSYGHHDVGEQITRSFLKELTVGQRIIDASAGLIKEHMQPILLYKQRDNVTDRMIRELITRVNLRELLLLVQADFSGRDSKRDFTSVRDWLLTRLANLDLDIGSTIEPLIRGRDLQQLGIIPGPAYKTILNQAWDLQLEGCSKSQIMEHLYQTMPDYNS